MKQKRAISNNGFGIIVIMLLTFGAVGELSAQLSFTWDIISRSKLWQTHENSLRYADNSLLETGSAFLVNYPGASPGANIDNLPNHLNSGGYAIYGLDVNGTAQAFTTTSFFYADELFISGENDMVKVRNFNIEDPSNPVEEFIEGSHIYNELNLEISMKVMAWSFPKYDDFIIKEITFTNRNSSGTVSDIHFAIRVATAIVTRGYEIGLGDFGDDLYGWSDEQQVFYFHDGRSFSFSSEEPAQFQYGPGPDWGDLGDAANLDPNVRSTELLSASYYTVVVLDSDGMGNYQNIFNNVGQGVGGGGLLEEDLPPIEANQPGVFKAKMTTQQPRMSWAEARANNSNTAGNKWEREPNFWNTVGPFDLAPGESRTVVYADVCGVMDLANVVAGGSANIALMQTASRDSLLANIAAARELYANGYRLADYPPPTPTNGENSLQVDPIGDGVQVAWPPISSSYTDPATGASDLAGYRVYRATWFTTGPFTRVADISVAEANTLLENGMIVYQDTGLPLGVGNYYGVTSYDNNGNESGLVNATRNPTYPLRAPNAEFPKKVYVVPNPFRQSSGLLGSGEELRMEFIGLPSSATIRIFTLAGELVKTIDHNDGSGAEAWGSISKLDYQTSEWFQYVAPGFYFFHVESHAEGSDGETFIGKFAVIK